MIMATEDTEGMPIVFSVEHDEVLVQIGNYHERSYFPRHWTDSEIEDWLWRKADRESKRVLRREVKIKSRKCYTNGSRYEDCL